MTPSAELGRQFPAFALEITGKPAQESPVQVPEVTHEPSVQVASKLAENWRKYTR